MKRRAFLRIGLCAGLVLLAGCCVSRQARETAKLARLADRMAVRLEIARDVAWAKAQSGTPVLDLERERMVLAALVNQGEAAGLSRERVERFFSAQIAASREVQTELLAAWAAGREERPKTPPLDLRTRIRPRLDAVSAELIGLLARVPDGLGDNQRAGIDHVLRMRGFSSTVRALAVEGL